MQICDLVNIFKSSNGVEITQYIWKLKLRIKVMKSSPWRIVFTVILILEIILSLYKTKNAWSVFKTVLWYFCLKKQCQVPYSLRQFFWRVFIDRISTSIIKYKCIREMDGFKIIHEISISYIKLCYQYFSCIHEKSMKHHLIRIQNVDWRWLSLRVFFFFHS